LGKANVFDKDTVYIDDIDIKNIPDHLTIELEENKKEI